MLKPNHMNHIICVANMVRIYHHHHRRQRTPKRKIDQELVHLGTNQNNKGISSSSLPKINQCLFSQCIDVDNVSPFSLYLPKQSLQPFHFFQQPIHLSFPLPIYSQSLFWLPSKRRRRENSGNGPFDL